MKFMPLVLKQSLLSGTVAFVRILMSFLTNKILAVVLGPVSFAMVGQFQNIMMVTQAGGSLALQNGWVSLTAQYAKEEERRIALWRSGGILSGIGFLFVFVILFILSLTGALGFLFPFVSEKTLQIALLCAIPGTFAMVLISIVQSIANGFSAFRLWSILSISTYVTQALWVVLFVLWNHDYVLIGLATQSILALIISFIICHKKKVFSRLFTNSSAGFGEWKKFALMGIIPMVFMPFVLTVNRSLIGTSLGWDQAGLWQGAFRISDLFNVGISSVLGVVLLPRLSELKKERAFFKTLWFSLLGVLLVAFCLISIMCFFREFVVQFVLSKDFLPITNQMFIQWIGDFFRTGSWCLGLGLIVKQAAKTFLFLEILSHFLFLILCYIGISRIGIAAPFYAYAIENVIGFGLLFLFTLRNHYTWKPL